MSIYPIDEKFKQAFEAETVAVPKTMWNRVERQLDQATTSPTAAVRWRLIWGAVAASLLVGTLWINHQNTYSQTIEDLKNTATPKFSAELILSLNQLSYSPSSVDPLNG